MNVSLMFVFSDNFYRNLTITSLCLAVTGCLKIIVVPSRSPFFLAPTANGKRQIQVENFSK